MIARDIAIAKWKCIFTPMLLGCKNAFVDNNLSNLREYFATMHAPFEVPFSHLKEDSRTQNILAACKIPRGDLKLTTYLNSTRGPM